MAPDDRRHPDAERLAEYADGLLSAEASADVERHLVECADCRAVVADTMDLLIPGNGRQIEGASPAKVIPFRSRRWVTGVVAALAAAAAMALVVRVERPSFLFGPQTDRPELQELIAAVANEPTRPVEARLSGMTAYAPAPAATRGSGDREISPAIRIAAARVETLAQSQTTPENQAALGVAYLALGKLDDAVALLGGAAGARPSSASIQNDFAAALLTRATHGGNRGDAEAARLAAERTLVLDPRNPQAAFNRALALETLGLPEAKEAWSRARSLQDDAGWRAEAERHETGSGAAPR